MGTKIQSNYKLWHETKTEDSNFLLTSTISLRLPYRYSVCCQIPDTNTCSVVEFRQYRNKRVTSKKHLLIQPSVHLINPQNKNSTVPQMRRNITITIVHYTSHNNSSSEWEERANGTEEEERWRKLWITEIGATANLWAHYEAAHSRGLNLLPSLFSVCRANQELLSVRS